MIDVDCCCETTVPRCARAPGNAMWTRSSLYPRFWSAVMAEDNRPSKKRRGRLPARFADAGYHDDDKKIQIALRNSLVDVVRACGRLVCIKPLLASLQRRLRAGRCR